MIIDSCDELHNVRNIAAESRRCLGAITDDYLIEVSVGSGGGDSSMKFPDVCVGGLKMYPLQRTP